LGNDGRGYYKTENRKSVGFFPEIGIKQLIAYFHGRYEVMRVSQVFTD
jgi:hypothetical protein